MKHFEFKLDARGQRRIHEKPSRTEAVACRPWLRARDAVYAELVADLRVAATALAGPSGGRPDTR